MMQITPMPMAALQPRQSAPMHAIPAINPDSGNSEQQIDSHSRAPTVTGMSSSSAGASESVGVNASHVSQSLLQPATLAGSLLDRKRKAATMSKFQAAGKALRPPIAPASKAARPLTGARAASDRSTASDGDSDGGGGSRSSDGTGAGVAAAAPASHGHASDSLKDRLMRKAKPVISRTADTPATARNVSRYDQMLDALLLSPAPTLAVDINSSNASARTGAGGFPAGAADEGRSLDRSSYVSYEDGSIHMHGSVHDGSFGADGSIGSMGSHSIRSVAGGRGRGQAALLAAAQHSHDHHNTSAGSQRSHRSLLLPVQPHAVQQHASALLHRMPPHHQPNRHAGQHQGGGSGSQLASPAVEQVWAEAGLLPRDRPAGVEARLEVAEGLVHHGGDATFGDGAGYADDESVSIGSIHTSGGASAADLAGGDDDDEDEQLLHASLDGHGFQTQQRHTDGFRHNRQFGVGGDAGRDDDLADLEFEDDSRNAASAPLPHPFAYGVRGSAAAARTAPAAPTATGHAAQTAVAPAPVALPGASAGASKSMDVSFTSAQGAADTTTPLDTSVLLQPGAAEKLLFGVRAAGIKNAAGSSVPQVAVAPAGRVVARQPSYSIATASVSAGSRASTGARSMSTASTAIASMSSTAGQIAASRPQPGPAARSAAALPAAEPAPGDASRPSPPRRQQNAGPTQVTPQQPAAVFTVAPSSGIQLAKVADLSSSFTIDGGGDVADTTAPHGQDAGANTSRSSHSGAANHTFVNSPEPTARRAAASGSAGSAQAGSAKLWLVDDLQYHPDYSTVQGLTPGDKADVNRAVSRVPPASVAISAVTNGGGGGHGGDNASIGPASPGGDVSTSVRVLPFGADGDTVMVDNGADVDGRADQFGTQNPSLQASSSNAAGSALSASSAAFIAHESFAARLAAAAAAGGTEGHQALGSNTQAQHNNSWSMSRVEGEHLPLPQHVAAEQQMLTPPLNPRLRTIAVSPSAADATIPVFRADTAADLLTTPPLQPTLPLQLQHQYQHQHPFSVSQLLASRFQQAGADTTSATAVSTRTMNNVASDHNPLLDNLPDIPASITIDDIRGGGGSTVPPSTSASPMPVDAGDGVHAAPANFVRGAAAGYFTTQSDRDNDGDVIVSVEQPDTTAARLGLSVTAPPAHSSLQANTHQMPAVHSLATAQATAAAAVTLPPSRRSSSISSVPAYIAALDETREVDNERNDNDPETGGGSSSSEAAEAASAQPSSFLTPSKPPPTAFVDGTHIADDGNRETAASREHAAQQAALQTPIAAAMWRQSAVDAEGGSVAQLADTVRLDPQSVAAQAASNQFGALSATTAGPVPIGQAPVVEQLEVVPTHSAPPVQLAHPAEPLTAPAPQLMIPKAYLRISIDSQLPSPVIMDDHGAMHLDSTAPSSAASASAAASSSAKVPVRNGGTQPLTLEFRFTNAQISVKDMPIAISLSHATTAAVLVPTPTALRLDGKAISSVLIGFDSRALLASIECAQVTRACAIASPTSSALQLTVSATFVIVSATVGGSTGHADVASASTFEIPVAASVALNIRNGNGSIGHEQRVSGAPAPDAAMLVNSGVFRRVKPDQLQQAPAPAISSAASSVERADTNIGHGPSNVPGHTAASSSTVADAAALRVSHAGTGSQAPIPRKRSVAVAPPAPASTFAAHQQMETLEMSGSPVAASAVGHAAAGLAPIGGVAGQLDIGIRGGFASDSRAGTPAASVAAAPQMHRLANYHDSGSSRPNTPAASVPAAPALHASAAGAAVDRSVTPFASVAAAPLLHDAATGRVTPAASLAAAPQLHAAGISGSRAGTPAPSFPAAPHMHQHQLAGLSMSISAEFPTSAPHRSATPLPTLAMNPMLHEVASGRVTPAASLHPAPVLRDQASGRVTPAATIPSALSMHELAVVTTGITAASGRSTPALTLPAAPSLHHHAMGRVTPAPTIPAAPGIHAMQYEYASSSRATTPFASLPAAPQMHNAATGRQTPAATQPAQPHLHQQYQQLQGSTAEVARASTSTPAPSIPAAPQLHSSAVSASTAVAGSETGPSPLPNLRSLPSATAAPTAAALAAALHPSATVVVRPTPVPAASAHVPQAVHALAPSQVGREAAATGTFAHRSGVVAGSKAGLASLQASWDAALLAQALPTLAAVDETAAETEASQSQQQISAIETSAIYGGNGTTSFEAAQTSTDELGDTDGGVITQPAVDTSNADASQLQLSLAEAYLHRRAAARASSQQAQLQRQRANPDVSARYKTARAQTAEFTMVVRAALDPRTTHITSGRATAAASVEGGGSSRSTRILDGVVQMDADSSTPIKATRPLQQRGRAATSSADASPASAALDGRDHAAAEPHLRNGYRVAHPGSRVRGMTAVKAARQASLPSVPIITSSVDTGDDKKPISSRNVNRGSPLQRRSAPTAAHGQQGSPASTPGGVQAAQSGTARTSSSSGSVEQQQQPAHPIASLRSTRLPMSPYAAQQQQQRAGASRSASRRRDTAASLADVPASALAPSSSSSRRLAVSAPPSPASMPAAPTQPNHVPPSSSAAVIMLQNEASAPPSDFASLAAVARKQRSPQKQLVQQRLLQATQPQQLQQLDSNIHDDINGASTIHSIHSGSAAGVLQDGHVTAWNSRQQTQQQQHQQWYLQPVPPPAAPAAQSQRTPRRRNPHVTDAAGANIVPAAAAAQPQQRSTRMPLSPAPAPSAPAAAAQAPLPVTRKAASQPPAGRKPPFRPALAAPPPRVSQPPATPSRASAAGSASASTGAVPSIPTLPLAALDRAATSIDFGASHARFNAAPRNVRGVPKSQAGVSLPPQEVAAQRQHYSQRDFIEPSESDGDGPIVMQHLRTHPGTAELSATHRMTPVRHQASLPAAVTAQPPVPQLSPPRAQAQNAMQQQHEPQVGKAWVRPLQHGQPAIALLGGREAGGVQKQDAAVGQTLAPHQRSQAHATAGSYASSVSQHAFEAPARAAFAGAQLDQQSTSSFLSQDAFQRGAAGATFGSSGNGIVSNHYAAVQEVNDLPWSPAGRARGQQQAAMMQRRQKMLQRAAADASALRTAVDLSFSQLQQQFQQAVRMPTSSAAAATAPHHHHNHNQQQHVLPSDAYDDAFLPDDVLDIDYIEEVHYQEQDLGEEQVQRPHVAEAAGADLEFDGAASSAGWPSRATFPDMRSSQPGHQSRQAAHIDQAQSSPSQLKSPSPRSMHRALSRIRQAAGGVVVRGSHDAPVDLNGRGAAVESVAAAGVDASDATAAVSLGLPDEHEAEAIVQAFAQQQQQLLNQQSTADAEREALFARQRQLMQELAVLQAREEAMMASEIGVDAGNDTLEAEDGAAGHLEGQHHQLGLGQDEQGLVDTANVTSDSALQVQYPHIQRWAAKHGLTPPKRSTVSAPPMTVAQAPQPIRYQASMPLPHQYRAVGLFSPAAGPHLAIAVASPPPASPPLWYIQPSSSTISLPAVIAGPDGSRYSTGIQVHNGSRADVLLTIEGPRKRGNNSNNSDGDGGAGYDGVVTLLPVYDAASGASSSVFSSPTKDRALGFGSGLQSPSPAASPVDGASLISVLSHLTRIPGRSTAEVGVCMSLPSSGRRVQLHGWAWHNASQTLSSVIHIHQCDDDGLVMENVQPQPVRVIVAAGGWTAIGYLYDPASHSLVSTGQPATSAANTAGTGSAAIGADGNGILSPFGSHPMGGFGPRLAGGTHAMRSSAVNGAVNGTHSQLQPSRELRVSSPLHEKVATPAIAPVAHAAVPGSNTSAASSTVITSIAMSAPNTPLRPASLDLRLAVAGGGGGGRAVAAVGPRPLGPRTAHKLSQPNPMAAGSAVGTSNVTTVSAGGSAANASDDAAAPLGLHFPMRAIYFDRTTPGTLVKVKVQLCNTSSVVMSAKVSVVAADRSVSWVASGGSSIGFKVKRAHSIISLQPRSFCMLPVSFTPPATMDIGAHGAEGAIISRAENGRRIAVITAMLAVTAELSSSGSRGADVDAASADGSVRTTCRAMLVAEVLLD